MYVVPPSFGAITIRKQVPQQRDIDTDQLANIVDLIPDVLNPIVMSSDCGGANIYLGSFKKEQRVAKLLKEQCSFLNYNIEAIEDDQTIIVHQAQNSQI